MNAHADVDAVVSDVVRTVRDRFGSEGLRDLISLASAELRRTEAVTAEPGSVDVADTQAWIAYTGDD